MVDAVITWVDGDDPSHVEKKNKHMKSTAISLSEEAAGRKRYQDSDEIRYCLRSIYNNAPWVKRIFLITDNQYPSSINKSIAEKLNIYQINHEEIFKGHENYLPTFNSRSIESMMWRIPGLSEEFIYLNDDFFFCRKTKKKDFFIKKRPVIRIRTRKKPQAGHEDLYQSGIIKSNNMIKPRKWLYSIPVHGVYPLLKSSFENPVSTNNNEIIKNSSFKFRSAHQFQPVMFAYCDMVYEKGMPSKKFTRMHNIMIPQTREKLPSFEIRKFLHKYFGFYKIACINNFYETSLMKNNIVDWIDMVTGPTAPFEL